MAEIITHKKYLVCLYLNGRCTLHLRSTHKILFLNKNEDEVVKSIFHNKLNDSLIIVSVTKKDDYNTLKCRSVSFLSIENGEQESKRLFKQFKLRYPDFIEFDEMNGKIITRHNLDQSYRVWSLETYLFEYIIRKPEVAEFKIW